jgi:hypothetical protein
MDLTASQLTKFARDYFKIFNYRLNRVNNIPVRKRKGTIEKGWADLQGYNSDGIYVAVEVKKIGDTLKQEQKLRLQDVTSCGGEAFICTEQNGKPVLIPYKDFEQKK